MLNNKYSSISAVFPGIIFGFDQPVLTVSEGVRAVVCVRTIAIGGGFEGDIFLPLRLVPGSASGK